MADETDNSSSNRDMDQQQQQTQQKPDGSVSERELEELRARAAKAEELESLVSDFDKLLKPAHAVGDPSEINEALERVMRRAGYSTGEIQEMIRARTAFEEEARTGRTADRDRDQDRGYGGGEEDDDSQTSKRLAAKLAALEEHQVSVERDRLEHLIGQAVSNEFARPELGSVLGALGALSEAEARAGKGDRSGEHHSEEAIREKVGLLAGEVRKETLEILRQKRAANPNAPWRDSWVPEAASQAARTVARRVRALVGDPEKIRRTAVPPSELEAAVLGKEPEAPPVYKKGMDMADVEERSRRWAVDYLLRVAAATPEGGSAV